jgi:hypothetical protein
MMGDADTAMDWKRYDTLIDLYKFYTSNLIDFHKFYLPAIGAVISYTLREYKEGMAVWALSFPIIISLGASLTLFLSIPKAIELQNGIRDLAINLKIVRAHAEILVWSTIAFGVLHTAIFGGLIALFVLKN